MMSTVQLFGHADRKFDGNSNEQAAGWLAGWLAGLLARLFACSLVALHAGGLYKLLSSHAHEVRL